MKGRALFQKSLLTILASTAGATKVAAASLIDDFLH
jgi:hypothetical protein